MAKVYGHCITVNYRESYGLYACSRHPLQPREPAPRPRVRHPQGHPRRGRDQARPGRRARLGNLDAERDWGYAGDYVEAMWLMLQQDEPDDYVIATGVDPLRARALSRSPSATPASTPERTCVKDPQFMRPAEVDLLLGDSAQGRAPAGLAARTTFEELVPLMVDADVALLSSGVPQKQAG